GVMGGSGAKGGLLLGGRRVQIAPTVGDQLNAVQCCVKGKQIIVRMTATAGQSERSATYEDVIRLVSHDEDSSIAKRGGRYSALRPAGGASDLGCTRPHGPVELYVIAPDLPRQPLITQEVCDDLHQIAMIVRRLTAKRKNSGVVVIAPPRTCAVRARIR